MRENNYLSSEQVSHVFTAYSPETIRELGRKGRLPVACWVGDEPGFGRDPVTIRALIGLSRREGRSYE